MNIHEHPYKPASIMGYQHWRPAPPLCPSRPGPRRTTQVIDGIKRILNIDQPWDFGLPDSQKAPDRSHSWNSWQKQLSDEAIGLKRDSKLLMPKDPLWSAYHLPIFVAARNRILWSRAMTSASQRLDRGDHEGPGFVPKPNDRSVRETTPFQGFLSQFKDCVICPEKWEVSGGKSSYKAFLEFKLTFDLGYRSMKLELQMWIDVNRILANCGVAHSVVQDLR